MKIEVKNNDKSIYINRQVCSSKLVVEDSEKVKKDILHYADKGYQILIDGVSVNEYYNGKQKVIEEKSQGSDYADLFDVHWRKRVDAVKEYTTNVDEVEKILEYAKSDEQPDSVIEGIEEYLAELRG